MAAVDVESTLEQLRASLGSGSTVAWPTKTFGQMLPPWPQWTGVLAEAACDASAALESARHTLSETDAAVGPLVAQANTVSAHARSRLDAILAQWRADQTALAPIANTPAGKAALLHWGAVRLADGRAVITTAQEQFTQLAGQLNDLTDRLPATGTRGTIQAAGYGPLPESPRVPPPEAPWEYDIDFTSQVEAGKDGQPVVNAGSVASVDDVWKELNRCFNCNFPMGGAPRNMPKVGDKLPLEIRAAGEKLANFLVRVTQIQKTAKDIDIEFVTLPGHVDGPGSTIHFHFFEQGGQLHLGTRGFITQGPGSGDVPIWSSGARAGYSYVAHMVWQPYINNVTRNIAASKGYFTSGPGQ